MRNYTIQDGLPSNTVYCVYKDSKGALWFGTDKGIARYNGVRFEKFSTADGLPDNEIFCLGEDKYNRLWMGTYNSALCYYKDGIIHTAANTPFLKLPSKFSFISGIFNEYDGSVTITFAGSTFLNIIGDKIHLYNVDALKEDNWFLRQIAKVAPSQYKITYRDYYYIWDTSGKGISKTKTDLISHAVINNNKRYQTGDTTIYRDGHVVCNIPKHDSMQIHSVLEDPERNRVLWGTTKGLHIFPDNTTLLKNKNVSSVIKDTLGNYWLSTTNTGVYCFNTSYKHFLLLDNADKERIQYARVIGGQVYFATQKGNLYTLRDNRIKKLFDEFQYKDELIRRKFSHLTYNFDRVPAEKILITPTLRRTENRDPPVACYIDDDLHFYVFSSYDKLILDKLTTEKAHVFGHFPISTTGTCKNIAILDSVVYLHMYQDIVYIPRSTLQKQDGSKGRLITINPKKHERFFGWAKDATGNIWTSTIDSLYKIEGDKVIAQREYGAIGLRKFGIWSGFLMGYTHNNTLLICHLAHQKLVIDTSINGGSIWNDFYPVDSTHIIISSDKYHMVTLTAPGRKNGFHIQTIDSRFLPLQAEYICADSATCYFFKDGTITSIDTKRLFDASAKPVVDFIYLRTKDTTYAASDPAVSIPYRQGGDLQISYLPLSFSGGDLQCEYSIAQDSSNDWHPIDETNIHLYLTHYGTYYIRVRAKASSDIYSDIATLRLVIEQPFWASWWFITLIIIASLAVVWLIIIAITRSILRRRQKDYEADMKYQRMEFKALNALMNPHFIFNTLNNIQNLFKNQQHKADEYFVTFARLIRQNMQNVTKDTVSLEQELNLVANYLKLEKLRFGDFVNYTMDVDPELDLDNVFIPPLLIQPLVENSIRHGLLPKESPENKVIVRVFEKGKSLFVEIEDNGVGLSNKTSHIDPQHESLGLSNLRKRIEHMNRAHNMTITFSLTEIKSEAGKIMGTMARIEITSLRW